MKRIIFTLAASSLLSILSGLFMVVFWHEATKLGYPADWRLWAVAIAPMIGGLMTWNLIGQAITFKGTVDAVNKAAAILSAWKARNEE